MFRLVLLVLLGLATLKPALAQNENSKDPLWLGLPTITNCASIEQITAMTQRYNEVPIAQGDAMVLVPTENGVMPGKLHFYISDESTFTIVLMISETVGCVIGMGNDFQPYDSKSLRL